MDFRQQLRQKEGLVEATWGRVAVKSEQTWPYRPSLHFLEFLWCSSSRPMVYLAANWLRFLLIIVSTTTGQLKVLVFTFAEQHSFHHWKSIFLYWIMAFFSTYRIALIRLQPIFNYSVLCGASSHFHYISVLVGCVLCHCNWANPL